MLATLIEERKFRVKEFADAVGVRTQAIYNAMSGERKTRRDNLRAMVRVLASRQPIGAAQREEFLRVFGLPETLFDEAHRQGDAVRRSTVGIPGIQVDPDQVSRILNDCLRRLDPEAAVGLSRLMVAMASLIEQAEIRGRDQVRALDEHAKPPPARRRETNGESDGRHTQRPAGRGTPDRENGVNGSNGHRSAGRVPRR